MCGIAGIAGLQDTLDASTRIQRMTDTMPHRGPDADGHFVADNIALGHRRLSIIDLSAASNQPFTDVSGRFVMIFNGEVYNYKALRAELSDYPFRTQSDTEVVLAAYTRWGKEFIHRLQGMFAFALWDKDTQTLLVARDRLGIKPLYYTERDGVWAFASEVRTLLQANIASKAIRPESLVDYMTYYTVHAPHTMLQDVKQLMPGQYGEWHNGAWKAETYWKLGVNRSEAPPTSYDEAKTRVRTLMRESVEMLMASDVPLGAFLSGGIDSSAIVALMAESSNTPANTFSIGFQEKEFDESDYATLIARKYSTDHTSIILQPQDFLDALPAALDAMDMPSGDGVNTYVISGAIRKAGIKVALSGLGGDELFAGYPVFKQWASLHDKAALWAIPLPLRRMAASLVRTLAPGHKADRYAELLSAPSNALADTYPIFRKLIPAHEIAGMGPNLPAGYNAVAHQLRAVAAETGKLPLLSQVSIGEITGYTQNVLLRDSDQFSMAHSLELRVPFFEYPLVEYVLSIPDAFKYPTYPKKLLVEALHPLLPDDIVHRKKMGFSFPWDTWLRNDLREFCALRMERLASRNVLAGGPVRAYWERFLAGDPAVTWARVWPLVVLDEWFEKVLKD